MLKHLLNIPTFSELINEPNKDAQTPLYLAVAQGDEAIGLVIPLLQTNNLDLREQGHMALHSAIESKSNQIVQELCKYRNIDINHKFDNDKTLLEIATRENNLEAVKALSKYPNINMATDGHMALQNAIILGYNDIVKELCQDNRININNNPSLLQIAIESNNPDVTKILCQHKNIDLHTQGPQAIYLLLTEHNNNDHANNIIEEICNHSNININHQFDDDKTILMTAVEQNNLDAVKTLCQYPNIDINCPDNTGKTPLYVALENHPEIATYLMSRPHINLDVTVQGKHITTLTNSDVITKKLATDRENSTQIINNTKKQPSFSTNLAKNKKSSPTNITNDIEKNIQHLEDTYTEGFFLQVKILFYLSGQHTE